MPVSCLTPAVGTDLWFLRTFLPAYSCTGALTIGLGLAFIFQLLLPLLSHLHLWVDNRSTGAMQHSWGTEIKGSIPGVEFSTFLCHSEVIAPAGSPWQCQPTAEAALYGRSLWRNWECICVRRAHWHPGVASGGQGTMCSPLLSTSQGILLKQINSLQKCNH